MIAVAAVSTHSGRAPGEPWPSRDASPVPEPRRGFRTHCNLEVTGVSSFWHVEHGRKWTAAHCSSSRPRRPRNITGADAVAATRRNAEQCQPYLRSSAAMLGPPHVGLAACADQIGE